MWDTTKQPPPQMQQTPPQQYIQAQVYNVPPSSFIPTYPTVQPVAQNNGWWSRNRKNKPQSNSVGTASLIFISGGMNMAWKLGLLAPNTYVFTEQLLLSWFIGGIIGAVIGAFACNHIPKKQLMILASLLVIICGVLQVTDPNSYNGILASRYLNGIAVGLIFPMTFVLAGEEFIKSIRGMNTASIDTLSFSCGIFIQVLYSALWYRTNSEDTLQSIQTSGILNIIYGIVALTMGCILVIESPVLYLSRGDEQMAIDSLRRLQKPFVITHETYEQLQEHKLYLANSKEKSFRENLIYGLPALLKLCFYRSFMALGFSYFVNYSFTYSSIATTQLDAYPFILYGIARWLGAMISKLILDSRGRKPFMILGFFVCTILAFAVGSIFDNSLNIFDMDYMTIVKYLLIVFQFFASMSMVSSSAYLTEAFPLAIKPYYVAVVFIVEMLVHILVLLTKDFYINKIFNISEFFFILGSLSFVFLGVAIFVMPETKMNSLRECLPKFRQMNNYRN